MCGLCPLSNVPKEGNVSETESLSQCRIKTPLGPLGIDNLGGHLSNL
jgi:hypothetical protein